MTDFMDELALERRVSDREGVDRLLGALRQGTPVVLLIDTPDEAESLLLTQYAAGVAAAVGGVLRQDGWVLRIDPYQRTRPADDTDGGWSSYAAAIAVEVYGRIASQSSATAGRVKALQESPGDVADHLVSALPLPDVWDDRIGPFYDTAGLRRRLDVSRQALHARVHRRAILAVRTGDGTLLYPSFQFGTDGSPLPYLSRTLELLDPEGVDFWGDALWLNTVAAELGGITPASALRSGEHERVLAIAARIGESQVG